jgi:hypothetical protein
MADWHFMDWLIVLICVSAWKIDPVRGVIGVQL